MLGCGVSFEGASTKGKLVGCDISDVGGVCIVIQESADPLLLSCKINGGKGGGVVIDNAKGRLLGNSVWGHTKACCIIQRGSDSELTNNKLFEGADAGISILGFSTLGRLEGNQVWGHANYGLKIGEEAAAEVAGNTIRDCRTGGVLIDGPSRVSFRSNRVFCNLINNVKIQGGTNALLSDNYIHDVGSAGPLAPFEATAGVLITGAGSPRLESNFLYRNQGGQLRIQLGSDPIVIINTIFDGPGRGVTFADSSTKGVLRANNIRGHRLSEVSIHKGATPRLEENLIHDGFGSGISVEGRLTGGLLRKNEIYNFPNIDGSCLYISDSPALEITDNRIHDGAGDGITITDGSRCTLRGNEVWDHGQSAVAVKGGANPLIIANQFHDASLHGIIFSGEGTTGRLLKNFLWGHVFDCVHIRPNADPIISGNAIYLGGESGVMVSRPGALGRITGNAIWACGEAGVEVTAGGRPSLMGNFLCDNAGAGVLFAAPGADEALVGAGNVFAGNAEGDVVIFPVDGSPTQREAGYYDRALCSGCGAAGAALMRCNDCMLHGKVFSPRYCGPACQRAHWKAHKPDCQRAEERAGEWLHAMDALLDLPGCPYGDLELLAQRQRQRELEAAEPKPGPSS